MMQRWLKWRSGDYTQESATRTVSPGEQMWRGVLGKVRASRSLTPPTGRVVGALMIIRTKQENGLQENENKMGFIL